MPKTTNKPIVDPATTYEYLRRAQYLLETPRLNHPHSWIAGAEAIQEDGNHCRPESEKAVAWCTIGVVKAVTHYDNNPDEAYRYVLSILNLANPKIIQQGSIPQVNDSGTFEKVIRMFEKAKVIASRMS